MGKPRRRIPLSRVITESAARHLGKQPYLPHVLRDMAADTLGKLELEPGVLKEAKRIERRRYRLASITQRYGQGEQIKAKQFRIITHSTLKEMDAFLKETNELSREEVSQLRKLVIEMDIWAEEMAGRNENMRRDMGVRNFLEWAEFIHFSRLKTVLDKKYGRYSRIINKGLLLIGKFHKERNRAAPNN